MQLKMGGKFHLKLNIGERPIANKYREGKMKRTLKRELKVREIVERETFEPSHVVGKSVFGCEELHWYRPQGCPVSHLCSQGCTFSIAGQHQFALLDKTLRECDSFGCVIALERYSGVD